MVRDRYNPHSVALVNRFMNMVGRIGYALALLAVFGNSSLVFALVDRDEPYRVKQIVGVEKTALLIPGSENPRNSEGDFIELNDGRVLFVYTHFTDGGSDHASAHLAGRISLDGGLTWSDKDDLILANEGGYNIMSVSLLRLNNGDIALFYLRKNSLNDCRALMRLSADEASTWGEPVEVITDQVGYYVLNNDRVIQLNKGRLVCSVALHNLPSYEKPDWAGLLMCYFSDDLGKTWRRSRSVLKGARSDGSRVMLQEPGVIELSDGRLMMWARTDDGSQYLSWSHDQADSWSSPVPSGIKSPRSPASIERIPGRGDLLMVWNDHAEISEELKGQRTPFNAALSHDEGKTWAKSHILEDDPNGWYCYTAIDFVGERVLLGHSAGDRRTGGLNTLQITSFDIDWLYRPYPKH
ncbi:glycoside hydrolase [bacterium]|nr:glycoside hydrolase [bacterium]